MLLKRYMGLLYESNEKKIFHNRYRESRKEYKTLFSKLKQFYNSKNNSNVTQITTLDL